MISLRPIFSVDCSALEQLPSLPGVYLFYSSTSALPIYIGKSINLKQRVRSHFYNAKSDPKESRLMAQVERIDYMVTAGEVGALLLESTLIKQQLPLMNRRLRRTKRLHSFLLSQVKGFLQPKLMVIQNDQFTIDANLVGLYRSKYQALGFLENIIRQEQLCKKMLGLEKSSGSCFGYKIKRCSGACLDLETPDTHNFRLMEQLNKYRHKVWPFPSTIGLMEINKQTGHKEIHRINHWLYFGSYVYSSKELVDEVMIGDPQFDMDIYRILYGAIHGQNENVQIVELTSMI